MFFWSWHKNSISSYILWFISGLLITLLISCTTPKATSNGEIEFWTMQLQPQFTPFFTELNKTFETQNTDNKIRWVDVPWNAMESKILTAVSGKNAPDVVNLNPDFAAQLASRKAWLNLDEKITPEIKSQYLPKIWEANQIKLCGAENQCETTTFGIPWYLTTTVTVYNQELFKNAGVEKPPTTYEELAIVAEKVKSKTGKYAFFVPLIPNDSNEVLQSFVQMGVNLVNDQGKAAFNTPEGIKVFRFWVDLFQKDLLPPEIMTQGHRHALELYQAGELSLLGTGAEFLKTISNNAPTIYDQSGVAPQVTGNTNKRSVSVMNLVIPRDSNKLDAAINYALFVTNSDNQLNFAQQANVLPSHNDAIAKYISNLEQETTKDIVTEARKISAMQLNTAEVLIPPIKNINQLKKFIYENIQSAMLKEKTIEQAITDAANQWDNLSK
ncbi:N-acetyl-D-glucosamine ABC transport system [Geminocystis sp. NIES-3708]|uniref:ABC transporter substrate-binding protein n=1 Tax=Geminocystis sp. NIES-3708 TaxID=1615909 RepID=UPI0005FC4163|nr:sugar ABC transporter substrate-binding protein [Geminocystis sp. NIES-3708]BAQ59759.1 N-acetyl-D-glucosamine ABC transport system [Geminocystis sp. NIES-3708]